MTTVEVKRSLFRYMFDHLGITNYSEENQSTARFKYELNINPSEVELEQNYLKLADKVMRKIGMMLVLNLMESQAQNGLGVQL